VIAPRLGTVNMSRSDLICVNEAARYECGLGSQLYFDPDVKDADEIEFRLVSGIRRDS
jgi:hypothetical protein